MNKTLTLLTASLVALYGCGGGGSSSGSTSNQKGPSNQADFPIKNALFAPKPSTILNYVFEVDSQPDGNMSMLYSSLSADELIKRLQQDPESEELQDVVNLLSNFGVDQFYQSEAVFNEDQTQPEYTFYFAGTDNALHEITDLYFMKSLPTAMLMGSSPQLLVKGSLVEDEDPNIDISSNPVSVIVDLSGEEVKRMLDSFDYDVWVETLEDTAQCRTTWSQQIGKTGARKTLNVSGQSVEAAYLTEKNTYNLVCGDMELNDSKEFESTIERWFNPTLGLIEQTEKLKSEESPLVNVKASLNKIETASL